MEPQGKYDHLKDSLRSQIKSEGNELRDGGQGTERVWTSDAGLTLEDQAKTDRIVSGYMNFTFRPMLWYFRAMGAFDESQMKQRAQANANWVMALIFGMLFYLFGVIFIVLPLFVTPSRFPVRFNSYIPLVMMWGGLLSINVWAYFKANKKSALWLSPLFGLPFTLLFLAKAMRLF